MNNQIDFEQLFTFPTAQEQVMNFLNWLAKRNPKTTRQVSNEELQERAQRILDAFEKEQKL